MLYINYTPHAEPIRDLEVLAKIIEAYSFAVDGHDKQFDISNELVCIGIQLLCNRGEIKASNVTYMVEGREIETLREKLGSSTFDVAVPKDWNELPNTAVSWLNEYMGIE